MKSFAEWCQHYEYDPTSDTAKADYQRYREQLAALLQELPEEPPCGAAHAPQPFGQGKGR